MPSVHNPENVSIGEAELSDVASIEWRQVRQEIVSPPGDGEIYAGSAGYARAVVRGRLTFTDPAQAHVASGRVGALSATLKGVGDGSDQTLTIDNVRTGGSDNLTAHNRAATCAVEFLAVSSDGVTDPVTLT